MNRRRVVITGLGAVTPIGNDVATYWQNLLAGVSGVAPITQFDTTNFKVHFAGEVKDFHPETTVGVKEARRMDRFTQFAVIAAHEAVTDAGIDFAKMDPFRAGVIIGSGIGGLNEFEDGHNDLRDKGPGRISPFVIPKMIANAATGNVSIRYGLMGANSAVSTACASAHNATVDALRAIQFGYADVMITGGAEAAITPMGLGGFASAKALSSRNDAPAKASRPFDKDRDGFVLGEGAGLYILEELEHAKKRGAKIYAEVLAAGSTADAYHITAPHPEGLGACKAMEFAMADAGLNADQVQYVNAHGTSTELGDAAETAAIKKSFGDHARKLMVTSTKSMIGHLLGASGGAALIACCLSIKHGVVHPTINYDTPDPSCDLDYVPNQAREARVSAVVSNSFGFGGHNCCLAVGAFK
ncbi:MAG: beta-ketoacyl-ACP synthase II [Gemmataceae bacterium]|nr:beta-ketoacyl-ACP synthase II [Gemmataceae bacterium]